MARRWLTFATLLTVVGFSVTSHADDKKKRRKKKDKDEAAAPAPDPVAAPTPAPPPEPPTPTPTPSPSPSPEDAAGPWAVGVTAEQKTEAQRLLETGNQKFLDAKYQEALDDYSAAVKSWDHPAIRFNMVRSLVNLGRSVEAYDNLELALKYGEAPLEPQVYAEALTYKKLLLGQISEVELSCKEPGAVVTLDGTKVMSCPGKVTERLLPGAHVVVAKKASFLTTTREEMLLPGKRQTVSIELIPLTEAAVTTRRWAAWKPWAVVAGGAVVASIGGLLQWKAVNDFDSYDAAIERNCADDGCTEEELDMLELDRIESQAKLENRLAIGFMAVGGTAVVGGLVLLWMNRLHTHVPTEESRSPGASDRPAPPPITVAPSVGPDRVGLDLDLRF